MTQEPWERVVAALQRLGCVVVNESAFHVTLCRGAVLLQRIRKLSPVTVRAQRHLLTVFDFAEADYLAALTPA